MPDVKIRKRDKAEIVLSALLAGVPVTLPGWEEPIYWHDDVGICLKRERWEPPATEPEEVFVGFDYLMHHFVEKSREMSDEDITGVIAHKVLMQDRGRKW